MSGLKKGKEELIQGIVVILTVLGLILLFLLVDVSAAPIGPDDLNVTSNETKNATTSKTVNISGGYIATVNLSSTTQNRKWKGFVGQVSGLFTLDDASGSTLFDWSLSSITGEIYATRNSSTISWGGISCSNITDLEQENIDLNHTSGDDNITFTFNATFNSTDNTTISGTHDAFFVGSQPIAANSCPTLNTYQNNATQDTYFEEISLYDGASIVYATIMEPDIYGFDNLTYDFQMIVPDRGDPGFNSSTAYYVYIELGN